MRKAPYKIDQCALYKVKSKSRLADLLLIGKGKLKVISSKNNVYYDFKKRKPNGKLRDISAPRKDLKIVQSRIASLLGKVVAPDYLFAPVKGRSYVDNAALHVGFKCAHSLDIVDFFPSCSDNKVIEFFSKRLECSIDVSVILKNIVCRNGSLPQGSPCSSILAFLCYELMWNEINSLCLESKCKLSVYADDITISGQLIPGKLIWEIRKILKKNKFSVARDKEKSIINKKARITGVLVGKRLFLSNRQHLAIYNIQGEMRKVSSKDILDNLSRRLRGRIAQKNQITRHPKNYQFREGGV